MLAIAGDDAAAKQTVTAFLDSIGFDALDVGPLAEGWRFQRDTPAYGTPYLGDSGAEQLQRARVRSPGHGGDAARRPRRGGPLPRHVTAQMRGRLRLPLRMSSIIRWMRAASSASVVVRSRSFVTQIS